MKNSLFSTNDLLILRKLDDYHLYLLIDKLWEAANIMKSSWPGKPETYTVVASVEIAAREVACRNRWSPILSNGVFSTNGITYDTPNFRNWFRSYRRTYTLPFDEQYRRLDDGNNTLKMFSFSDFIYSIKRAA